MVLLTVLLLVMAVCQSSIIHVNIVLFVLEIYGFLGDEGLGWHSVARIGILQADWRKLAPHLRVPFVALCCLLGRKLL